MATYFIHRSKLADFMRKLHGIIFTAEFIKKDGSVRTMNARLGVKKGVKGTGHPNGLATPCIKVFDMQKDAFRQINLATVNWVKTSGVTYKVVD